MHLVAIFSMRMQEPRDAYGPYSQTSNVLQVKGPSKCHGSPLCFAIEKTELFLSNETAGSAEGQADVYNRTGA